jgi:hypothetical protein
MKNKNSFFKKNVAVALLVLGSLGFVYADTATTCTGNCNESYSNDNGIHTITMVCGGSANVTANLTVNDVTVSDTRSCAAQVVPTVNINFLILNSVKGYVTQIFALIKENGLVGKAFAAN